MTAAELMAMCASEYVEDPRRSIDRLSNIERHEHS
jgi:hypothetical protein